MKKNLVLTIATLLAINVALFAQVPNYVPTNGLVGWWPFNGNANDESGNGNNGTVNGATLTSDRFGTVNKAYSFNGTDNFIKCLNAGPIGNPTVTASFWMKTSQTTYGHIIGYGNNDVYGADFRVLISPSTNCSKTIQFDNYGSVLAKSDAQNNTWDFYTVIYDGSLGSNTSITKIYKNGAIIATTCDSVNSGVTSISNLFPITFGRYHGTIQTGFYNGSLDDIGMWNRALTQQEITDLYNAVNCTLAVSTQPSNQTSAIGSSATFITSTNDPSVTYQWQTNLGLGFQNLGNAGQYSGVNNDTLTVSNTTSINTNQAFRCIFNSGSCSDTSNTATLTVTNSTGIASSMKQVDVLVFPNPASTQLSIQTAELSKEKSFNILDNNGKVVYRGNTKGQTTTIDLRNLNNGLYVLVFQDGTKKAFQIIR